MAFENWRARSAALQEQQKVAEAIRRAEAEEAGWLAPILGAAGSVVGSIYGGAPGAAAGGAIGTGVGNILEGSGKETEGAMGIATGVAGLPSEEFGRGLSSAAPDIDPGVAAAVGRLVGGGDVDDARAKGAHPYPEYLNATKKAARKPTPKPLKAPQQGAGGRMPRLNDPGLQAAFQRGLMRPGSGLRG